MHATAGESPPKWLTTWTVLGEVGEILRACATGQSDRTCCDYHLVQRLFDNAGHEWLVVGSDFPDAATENASYKSHRGAEQFWPLSMRSPRVRGIQANWRNAHGG